MSVEPSGLLTTVTAREGGGCGDGDGGGCGDGDVGGCGDGETGGGGDGDAGGSGEWKIVEKTSI